MNMDRMGQPQLHHGLGDAGDNLARRDVEAVDRRVQPGGVAASRFPDFDTAGIDDFGRISLGRAE